MSLWVDKYRPKSLAKLDYHPELSENLEMLVRVLNYRLEMGQKTNLTLGKDRRRPSHYVLWAIWCWQGESVALLGSSFDDVGYWNRKRE
jgi:hypothetical protein